MTGMRNAGWIVKVIPDERKIKAAPFVQTQRAIHVIGRICVAWSLHRKRGHQTNGQCQAHEQDEITQGPILCAHSRQPPDRANPSVAILQASQRQ